MNSNRIVVKFVKEIRESDAFEDHVDRIRKLIPGGQLVRSPSRTGRALYEAEPGTNLKEIVEVISTSREVEYAEPDELDQAS